MQKIRILPSLLAADFGQLAAEARRAAAAGGDALHLDIMDAHFVPNLSMGPDVVAMAKRTVSIPLDVHLMMTQPDRYVERFVQAGADWLLIHVEASCDVAATLARIRALGVRPGITLNPDSRPDSVFPFLPLVDEVLCMTVFPGYGGQSFIATVLPAIRAIRDEANRIGRADMEIMVDGGIGMETAAECARQGANAFVAGTSLFRADDMGAAVGRMRAAAGKALCP